MWGRRSDGLRRSIGGVPIAWRVAVRSAGGLGAGCLLGGGIGSGGGAQPRAEARGPDAVHGELLQLSWGHLVEELVGQGLGVGGRLRDDVLAGQGEGTETAVAVAAIRAAVA